MEPIQVRGKNVDCVQIPHLDFAANFHWKKLGLKGKRKIKGCTKTNKKEIASIPKRKAGKKDIVSGVFTEQTDK